jgi:hypothetical protein
MRATLPLLALAALLLLPAASGHLAFTRPSIQPGEGQRLVDVAVKGSAATVDLLDRTDPLRHAVRHEVDPARGLVRVEHRADPPDAGDAFSMRLTLTRFLEYRDVNADGRYAPGVDVALRPWPFAAQPWKTSPVQNVTVGGAPSRSVSWNANATGAPHLDLAVAATGFDVTDEGARARPQDVLLYLDLKDLPARGTGNLHVLEMTLAAPPGSALAPVLSPENQTVGVRVDHDGRRAFLLWGGQATVDGREQLLAFSQEPAQGDGADATWLVRLHFPLMDRGAHVVLVSGVEYETPVARTPGLETWALVAVACGLAAARVGRRRA